MAEPTKAELEAELESSRSKLADTEGELERTRGELAEARAKTVAAPATSAAAAPGLVTFASRPNFRSGTKLSEGERQALEIAGVVADPHGGGQLLASDFGVEVKTEGGRAALAAAEADRAKSGDAKRAGIQGVDFVYPSVAPGVLAQDAPVRGAQPDTVQVAK